MAEAGLAEAGLAEAELAEIGLAEAGLTETEPTEAGLLVALLAMLAGVADTRCGFQPRRRRAFDTTHTLEQLMAAAAIMGFSVKPATLNRPAATGMHTVL